VDKTTEFGRLIQASRLFGIDFIGSSLRETKTKGIHCVAVDLNQAALLPFPDLCFDCIHAGEVIEHLFSPDQLLKEIFRLLKPDGYAVISTPNLASWRNRLALLLGWQPFFSEVSTVINVGNPRNTHGIMSGHIRLFTPGALVQLAGHYGLSVTRTTGWATGRPNSPLTHVFAVVDWILEKHFPFLCDDLIIKVMRMNSFDPSSITPDNVGK
jgi:SAM-dependent methyltransferase